MFRILESISAGKNVLNVFNKSHHPHRTNNNRLYLCIMSIKLKTLINWRYRATPMSQIRKVCDFIFFYDVKTKTKTKI